MLCDRLPALKPSGRASDMGGSTVRCARLQQTVYGLVRNSSTPRPWGIIENTVMNPVLNYNFMFMKEKA